MAKQKPRPTLWVLLLLAFLSVSFCLYSYAFWGWVEVTPLTAPELDRAHYNANAWLVLAALSLLVAVLSIVAIVRQRALPEKLPAGVSAAAALAQLGGMKLFTSSVTDQPRAPLCGMGICFSCHAEEPPGLANRLTCQMTWPADTASLTPSPARKLEVDALIVGAGPAGLAAAAEAASSGKRIAILDDNPAAGGQIWRADSRKPPSPSVRSLLTRAQRGNLTVIQAAKVVAAPEAHRLSAETPEGLIELHYAKLILATGARELFLPFPGWTLPGVMGAGGLQALVKGGWPIAGKRVVVAGSGPLLLAVAAYLKKAGAIVSLIAEQAPAASVNRFARSLWRSPGKLLQGIGLRLSLLGVPYRCGHWPIEALGSDHLEAVRLGDENGKTTELPCDYLACGFGLVPNSEPAELLGCKRTGRFVDVNDLQQTSVPGIYAAGEITGIGGLDKSLVEGAIAGLAAIGETRQAQALFGRRQAALRFAEHLNHAFALCRELKSLARPDTFICRCEDVPLSALNSYASWRAAKLQTRCGMGPCQGRVCGPITEFLFGWPTTSVRPPLFPARLGSLCAAGDEIPKDEPS